MIDGWVAAHHTDQLLEAYKMPWIPQTSLVFYLIKSFHRIDMFYQFPPSVDWTRAAAAM